jgi:hypothetical protein
VRVGAWGDFLLAHSFLDIILLLPAVWLVVSCAELGSGLTLTDMWKGITLRSLLELDPWIGYDTNSSYKPSLDVMG